MPRVRPLTLARLVFLVVLLPLAGASGGRAQDAGPPVASPASGATAGGWTNWKGDAGRTGVADSGPTGQPVQLWRVQAGGPCNPPPAAVAGVVYVPCDDGVLYALDAATGTERWRFAGTGLGDVTVVGDLVYVNDADVLYALDAATGQERWQAAVPGGTSAVVDDELLVIGTGDGFLLGLVAATGAERWRFRVSATGAAHSPVLGDGIAYAGGGDPGFFAVDAATGTLLWRGDTGDDHTATAVVAEGIAYIGGSPDSGAGHLYAFDATTGALLWRRDEPIFTPTVLAGVGYAGSAAGIVYAFDTATGAERWRVQLGEAVRNVAIANGALYTLSDADRAVYALDAVTGAQLWSFPVNGGIDGGIAVAGGVLYVATTAGTIHAIGGTDQGAAPVVSPVPATPSVAVAAPAEFVWQTTGGPEGIDTFYVAVAPDGTVWANDAGKGRFQLFSPDGRYLETWVPEGVPTDSALFVAFDRSGTIYVLDGLFVRTYGPDRAPLAVWGGQDSGGGQFLNTTGIGVDAAGNVYVCDELRNDVQKFAPDGRFLAKWGGPGSGDGQFNGPGFMDVDPEGNSYVVDQGRGNVQVFAPDGTFLLSIAGEGDGKLGAANDVAIDEAGNIYVSESGRGEIKVFDATGRFLTSWGEFGSGEGQLLSGDAVALDGAGGVYVADNAAGRVVKFRLLPPLAPG